MPCVSKSASSDLLLFKHASSHRHTRFSSKHSITGKQSTRRKRNMLCTHHHPSSHDDDTCHQNSSGRRVFSSC